MDPEEPCICGHERKWHDACSQCECPFFLVSAAPAGVRRLWTKAGRDRKRREKGRDRKRREKGR